LKKAIFFKITGYPQDPNPSDDFTRPFLVYLNELFKGGSEGLLEYYDYELPYQRIRDEVYDSIKGSSGIRKTNQELIQRLAGFLSEDIVRAINEDGEIFGMNLSAADPTPIYILP